MVTNEPMDIDTEDIDTEDIVLPDPLEPEQPIYEPTIIYEPMEIEYISIMIRSVSSPF